MRTYLSFSFLVFSLALGRVEAFAQSPLPRVSSCELRAGEVRPLRLTPGYISTLEFQAELKEVRLGDSGSFWMEVDPPRIFLQARSGAARASNLFIRTAQGLVIWDLDPTGQNHQDYLKVKVKPQASPRKLLQQGETF